MSQFGWRSLTLFLTIFFSVLHQNIVITQTRHTWAVGHKAYRFLNVSFCVGDSLNSNVVLKSINSSIFALLHLPLLCTCLWYWSGKQTFLYFRASAPLVWPVSSFSRCSKSCRREHDGWIMGLTLMWLCMSSLITQVHNTEIQQGIPPPNLKWEEGKMCILAWLRNWIPTTLPVFFQLFCFCELRLIVDWIGTIF